MSVLADCIEGTVKQTNKGKKRILNKSEPFIMTGGKTMGKGEPR